MLVIFRMLFNISVSASILAAAVIVFRLLFKKAPKWIICLLWGLVGLRLVFPFSVESIIGLLPRSNIITDSGTVNTGIYAVDDVITGMAHSIATVAAPATHSAKTGMGTTAVIGEILFYVWLAGFIAMTVASVVSFIKIRLKVNQSIKLRDNIYICDEIDTPFILGIFRPEIFIPSGLDETKIQSIIAHENSHIHRKDNWWKPLGFLLLSVYWFNPVMWIAYILLCRDIEFACDEKVLKDLTAEEVANYSQTLLDCSKPGRLVTVCPLSFGEVGVKQRIKSALSYKKPALWIIIAALIISAVLAVAFTTKQRSGVGDIRLVTMEQGKYELYTLKGDGLKYEKCLNIPTELDSLVNMIPREAGMGKTAVQFSETLIYNANLSLPEPEGIYSDIYDLIDGRVDCTTASVFSDGESYYLSTKKLYYGDKVTFSGKIYEYLPETKKLRIIKSIPEGFIVGLYTVTEKESELKSEVTYKDVIGLWGTEDGEQQIRLDKKSQGNYPGTLLYYEDGKLQEDKFTYSLKYDSVANITNLIFSADDYLDTYIVSCNSNTMVMEYRDTETGQTDTTVFKKDFPLKEVVLTDNYNGKEPTTTAIYLSDEPEKSTTLTRPAETNQQENITRVGGIDIFRAKVLEVNDSTVLVEPLEGSYERNFANRIYVSKHIIDGGSEKKTFPDVSVGDIIEVSYANMDVQKNPAVIDTVYNVKKADSLSQKVPESKESGLPKMTNKDVERLKKKDNITWDDFKGYDGRDIGSGMYVIVYDLADGGSVRVSGPSLDEEPLSISYTHPDGTTEVLKQSVRTTEISTTNGLAYAVFISNNNKPYTIMSAPQRAQYGIIRRSARQTDLGEYVGEITKSGDSSLIGRSVYHYKAYPDSNDILIIDTGNGYDFYCAQ
jgi:beta-lactamase regulating signal transducer with metallopeptidase domain